jgi:hypothetical protein
MQPVRSSFLAAAVVMTLAGNVNAQIIMGPNTPVTGDSSVTTNGTEVWGGDVTANTTLANGVTFNHIFNSTWSPSGSPVSYPTVPAGPAVQAVMDGAAWGDQTGNLGFSDSQLNLTLSNNDAGGYQFLYIGNLTPGHVYTVQSFDALTNGGNINNAGTFNATQTVTFSNTFFGPVIGSTTLNYGQGGGGSGAFSTSETFVAGSGGTAFLLFNPSTNGVDILAAAQIRDITAVPEPSTYALMLGGLGLLAFFRFRARRA